VVTFTLDFPGSEPLTTHSVASDGHSTYDSDGKLSPESEADLFSFGLLVPPGQQTIFDLAKRPTTFEGQIDSKSVAWPHRTKTLAYKDASQSATATTTTPRLARSAGDTLFQNLSMTLEYGVAAVFPSLPEAGLERN